MRKIILFPLVVIALGAAAYYGPDLVLPRAVDVIKPVRGPAVQAVYATGTVEASVMMPIAPRTTAHLVELNVDEGASVKAGQLLARLEDTDVMNTLAQLQAQAQLAQSNYDRSSKLVAQGVVSRKSLDEVQSALQAANAAVAKASAEANYMKLTAPADGTIIRRDGEIGQLIPSGTAVFWMSCCAPLRITSEVDEEDIPLVKIGQSVLIQNDAFSGKVYHGTVQSITPKGDSDARSYRVRIGFAEDVPFMIGMTAETNIIISKDENALLVPVTAILDNKVYVVRDGHAVGVPVKRGPQGTAAVAILDGVTDSDIVIKKPVADLEKRSAVRAEIVPFTGDIPKAEGKKESGFMP